MMESRVLSHEASLASLAAATITITLELALVYALTAGYDMGPWVTGDRSSVIILSNYTILGVHWGFVF
jgi:hypothetical protein